MAGIHIGDSQEYKIIYFGNQRVSLYNISAQVPLNTVYSLDDYILTDINDVYLVAKEEE